MVRQITIHLPSHGRGFHLITHTVIEKLGPLPESGLCHLLIQHTSAGLTLNENADPSVRDDFESFMNRIVPENQSFYTHTLEGSDDLPAHIKSSIMGHSVTIPITNGKLNLGTWQGIYLCEFRRFAGSRTIIATVIG